MIYAKAPIIEMGLQQNLMIGRGPKQNESAMDEGINSDRDPRIEECRRGQRKKIPSTVALDWKLI
jgi:hypothetical protein